MTHKSEKLLNKFIPEYPFLYNFVVLLEKSVFMAGSFKYVQRVEAAKVFERKIVSLIAQRAFLRSLGTSALVDHHLRQVALYNL
jgi:hypothetical protein